MMVDLVTQQTPFTVSRSFIHFIYFEGSQGIFDRFLTSNLVYLKPDFSESCNQEQALGYGILLPLA